MAIHSFAAYQIVSSPASIALRRTANFHPSIWGDRFLAYMDEDPKRLAHMEKQIAELKESVRENLIASAARPLEQLNLIDAVQRLGVAYHFENEIEEALCRMYSISDDFEDDLYTAALRFRLLRQQGYKISSDILEKFKDERGNYHQHLTTDVHGMLGLYEAAHLRLHGEAALDEALGFCKAHLKSIAAHIGDPWKEQITHTLKRPIRKSLTRVEARRYIDVYQTQPLHYKTLLKFAKLDFNLIQSLHKKELRDLSLWWKGLDFANKLPFARDRLVECYFWILGVYFEPQYSMGRRILTKVTILGSIIDDIYDAYGTLDELALFTEAIERWDISASVHLPEYMQLCYQALLDVFEEMESETEKDGNAHLVCYAKQAMKRTTRAYFQEAVWCNQKHTPKMEEYMSVAFVSVSYPLLMTVSLLGMGEIAKREAFDRLLGDPKICVAASVIFRLMDDMAGHKFEQGRDHVASAVECYIEQYGVSEREAYVALEEQVVNAWKDINEEFLRPTSMPVPILMRALNLARVVDVLYSQGDGYTHVGKVMIDGITSLLIKPVP